MVDLNVTSMHIKNPSTGEWDEIAIIAGKSAYQSAVDGGYQGTEAEFNAELSDIKNAAEDAETAASHYPKIVNGYWYVWDATAGEFVNTGVSAEGKDGPAIVEVSATEPTDPTTEVWFKDQQSNPVEVYTVSEIDAMQGQALGNLAMIESSQATAAHAVGEYIVLNGQLYKVTAAIAAGQTLTPGTNIAAVSNGGFNELNAFGNPYFRLFSKPNVTCNGNSSAIIDISIGDVPSGWAATAVTSWIDTTDTTSAANYGQTFLLNEWSHIMQTGTGKTMHLMYSNLNSNQAKFTANMLVMYTRV